MKVMDTETRFWAKVEKTEGCWNWTGATHRGYGQFTLSWWKREDGKWRCKTVRAHRLAFEILVGPIPDGLTIEHECKNHGCVRPGAGHCFPLTQGENTLRGEGPSARNKRKTHCKRDHEFTEENTITRPGKPGHRECRTCTLEQRRAKYEPKERRGSCKEGHPFDEVLSNGQRSCKRCRRKYHREYQQSLRAEVK